MIENNVITKNNLLEFGENPFLMSELKKKQKKYWIYYLTMLVCY